MGEKVSPQPDPLAVEETKPKGAGTYEVRGSDGYDFLPDPDKGYPANAEGMRANSNEGLRVIERRGGLPNNEGSQPHGAEQRLSLDNPLTQVQPTNDLSPQVARYDAKKSDAEPTGLSQRDKPEFGLFYEELAKHEKEREPVNSVTTWKDTGQGKLPAAKSPIGDDVPQFDSEGIEPSEIGNPDDLPGFIGDVTPAVNPSND